MLCAYELVKLLSRAWSSVLGRWRDWEDGAPAAYSHAAVRCSSNWIWWTKGVDFILHILNFNLGIPTSMSMKYKKKHFWFSLTKSSHLFFSCLAHFKFRDNTLVVIHLASNYETEYLILVPCRVLLALALVPPALEKVTLHSAQRCIPKCQKQGPEIHGGV